MSKPTPARYRTTNWSSHTASLRKRGSLLIWLDKEMAWLALHDESPGRPAVFSDTAIQFCMTIKVLFKRPLRQTIGMVASLPKLANLDWAVPDYTTLCRRQKTLSVQVPYRRADGFLKLLVDRPRPPNRRNPDPRRTDEPLLRPRNCRNRSSELMSHGKGEVTHQAAVLQQCRLWTLRIPIMRLSCFQTSY